MLEQDYPADAFEVIVVDDGSEDGTAEWARSLRPGCHLEVVRRPPRGPAAARNAGIAAAGGEVLLFLDDDIVSEGNLLREHAMAHSEAPAEVAHGYISTASDSPRTLVAMSTSVWYDRRHSLLLDHGGVLQSGHIYLNANTSYPAQVMAEVGGFDEEMSSLEDVELGLRLTKLGTLVRYRPQARAYELYVKSSRSFVREARAQAEAEVMIARKHPKHRPYRALSSSDPPPFTSAAARYLFRRLPTGSEGVLDLPTMAAERVITRPRARAAGDRLLAIQRQVAFDRAASRFAGSARGLEAEFARYLPVLLYHRVGPPVRDLHPDLTVSPDRFARHLSWLRHRGYVSVTPSQWHEWRLGRGNLPHKPILLTFDDGYAELAEYAFPLLRRYGFGATVFIVTQRIGAISDWNAPFRPHVPTLKHEQILRWSQAGIDFQSHGRTHRDLSTLGDADIKDEILGSRTDLEEIVGYPVKAFAYPFGSRSAAAEHAVRTAYDLAFLDYGKVNVLTTPPHELRRAGVGPHDSGPGVEWRVWSGQRPLGAIRDRLRVRSPVGSVLGMS